jgi:hypothetical protein
MRRARYRGCLRTAVGRVFRPGEANSCLIQENALETFLFN